MKMTKTGEEEKEEEGKGENEEEGVRRQRRERERTKRGEWRKNVIQYGVGISFMMVIGHLTLRRTSIPRDVAEETLGHTDSCWLILML